MVASESASTAKRREIPVRKVPVGTMLAELDEKLRDYEFRHEIVQRDDGCPAGGGRHSPNRREPQMVFSLSRSQIAPRKRTGTTP